MLKLSTHQKIRISVLVSTTALLFVIPYAWAYQTITIENVVIYKNMCRPGFTGKKIAILPLGNIVREEIVCLKTLFAKLYGAEVEILPTEPIPKISLRKDDKYDLQILNIYLGKVKQENPSFYRLLGIIDEDTTAGDYDYLLGMASLTQEVATVTLKRLREEFYQRKPDPLLFRERMFKLALHEYSHTFYLFHCDDYCLMQFTPEIAKFDAKPAGLCWICLRNIKPEE